MSPGKPKITPVRKKGTRTEERIHTRMNKGDRQDRACSNTAVGYSQANLHPFPPILCYLYLFLFFSVPVSIRRPCVVIERTHMLKPGAKNDAYPSKKKLAPMPFQSAKNRYEKRLVLGWEDDDE